MLNQHRKNLKNGTVKEDTPSRKRKRDDDEDEEEEKKKRLPRTPEKCTEHVARLNDRLKKWEIKLTEKVFFFFLFFSFSKNV